MTRDYAYDYERRCLAHHEAGHGVIAAVLDLPVAFVSTFANSSSGGRCKLAAPIGQFDVLRVAVWTLAGPESEKLFRQAPRARLADDDYAFVRDVIRLTKRAADDVDALAAEYEALAAAKVRLHERWIKRTAAALLRHGRLQCADVYALRTDAREGR